MADKFTQKAQNVLNHAQTLAGELGHTYIGSEHLLLGLLWEEDCIAARLLRQRGADFKGIRKRVMELSGSGSPCHPSPEDMTPKLRRIIEGAASEALRHGNAYVGTEHLLSALLEEKDSFGLRLLEAEGLSSAELRGDLSAFLSASAQGTDRSGSKAEEKNKIPGAPTLSAHGRDLVLLAQQGRLDPVIGRDRETERLIHVLCRRTKNNPCLIGEPGVGKTAVVEGLALRILEGAVPEELSQKRLISLDLASMIAGAKYRGEFEDRMKRMMEEVRRNPQLILFLDELHMMMGAGAAEGAVDAANILKPALSRGELQMIGATTLTEYQRHVERDAALTRRFQPILLEEPSPEQAEQILRGLKDRYENHHGLKISDEALSAAVRLSRRYLPDRFLPDKALDLLDEAAAAVRLTACASKKVQRDYKEELRLCLCEMEEAVDHQDFERAAALRDQERALKRSLSEPPIDLSLPSPTVGAEDIAAVVTAQTGIPVGVVLEGEGARLLRLGERLRASVVGQDDAIDALSRAIGRGRCGLKEPCRPIGSFLLMGQTGVGKTFLARALARELFGSESAMLRLDMSEYAERHAVSRLIGAPPGYVGYGEGGQLTEPVRRRPYSVVLFDEIEKAHGDLWNLLLQVLEEGRLTDASGRTVDFTNTVILLTANPEGGAQKRISGFSEQGLCDGLGQREALREDLKRRFPPEFLNRLDEILYFRPLGLSQLTIIAEGLLRELGRRAEDLGFSLEVDPALPRFLAEQGLESDMGARPLRRAVVRLVEDPLAQELLEGRIPPASLVRCAPAANGREVTLSVQRAEAALCRAASK